MLLSANRGGRLDRLRDLDASTPTSPHNAAAPPWAFRRYPAHYVALGPQNTELHRLTYPLAESAASGARRNPSVTVA